MLRLVLSLVLFAAMGTASGCALPQLSPVYGGLITNEVKGPVGGVDNSVKPEKTGVAQAKSIVFFADGDASITAAMANGGITKVHHVDSEVFSILGIYAVHKTIVYGE